MIQVIEEAEESYHQIVGLSFIQVANQSAMIHDLMQMSTLLRLYPPNEVGGGPRVVVSTAAFHARVRGSVPGLGGLKETKCFFPIHV